MEDYIQAKMFLEKYDVPGWYSGYTSVRDKIAKALASGKKRKRKIKSFGLDDSQTSDINGGLVKISKNAPPKNAPPKNSPEEREVITIYPRPVSRTSETSSSTDRARQNIKYARKQLKGSTLALPPSKSGSGSTLALPPSKSGSGSTLALPPAEPKKASGTVSNVTGGAGSASNWAQRRTLQRAFNKEKEKRQRENALKLINRPTAYPKQLDSSQKLPFNTVRIKGQEAKRRKAATQAAIQQRLAQQAAIPSEL